MGKMKKIKRGFVTLLAAVVAATSLVPAAAEDAAADAGTTDSEERLIYQSSTNFSTETADGTWDGGIWSAQLVNPETDETSMITGTVALRDGMGANAEQASAYQTSAGGQAISAYRVMAAPRNNAENFTFNAAKVFTAPRTGRVTISCGGDKIQTSDGSKPSVRIRKLSNDSFSQVWPSSGSTQLGDSSTNYKHDSITLTLKEGEKLYFEGIRNTNGRDHLWSFIYWDPVVTYAPKSQVVQRERYQSSEFFNTDNADGTWDGGTWSAQLVDPETNKTSMIENIKAARGGMGANGEEVSTYQTSDGGQAVSAYRITPSPRNNVENFSFNAAKVFTAPRSGKITISCGDDRIQTSDGSGPSVRIRKLTGSDFTQIWPASGSQKLGWAAFNGKHDDITLTVKKGDKLYFEGIRNTNVKDNMWSNIYWDPIVTYAQKTQVVPRDTYQSSAFFSTDNADGTWDGTTWSAQLVNPETDETSMIESINTARADMGVDAETGNGVEAEAYQTEGSGQAVSAYKIAVAPQQVTNYKFNAAKVFTAPRSGSVTISCGGDKVQSTDGSKSRVRIRKLSNKTFTQVWPNNTAGYKELQWGGFNAWSGNVEIFLNEGEKLYFEGIRNPASDGKNIWSCIYWDPIVTYNDSIYISSAAFETADGETLDSFADICAADNAVLKAEVKLNKISVTSVDPVTAVAAIYDADGSLVGCKTAISEEIGTDGATVTVPLGEKTGLTRGKIKLFILDSLNGLTPVIGAEYTSIIKAN